MLVVVVVYGVVQFRCKIIMCLLFAVTAVCDDLNGRPLVLVRRTCFPVCFRQTVSKARRC